MPFILARRHFYVAAYPPFSPSVASVFTQTKVCLNVVFPLPVFSEVLMCGYRCFLSSLYDFSGCLFAIQIVVVRKKNGICLTYI